MKNFQRLDGLSILSVQYMYIDHKDYLADFLLAQKPCFRAVRKRIFTGRFPVPHHSLQSQKEGHGRI